MRLAKPARPISSLLTICEASTYLHMSVKTLRRRIEAGDIPIFRDGRLVRLRQGELDHYIATRITRGNE